PLDSPAIIEKRQVPGFRNVAHHLDTLASRPAFVALPDSLVADFRRLTWAETNRVICPQARHRNRISRQRGGNVLLVEFLDGGSVSLASLVPRRHGTSLGHVARRDRQPEQNNSDRALCHSPSGHSEVLPK